MGFQSRAYATFKYLLYIVEIIDTHTADNLNFAKILLNEWLLETTAPEACSI